MQYQSSCAPKLARKCGIGNWLTLAHDKYLLDLLKTDDLKNLRKPTMTKRFWTYIRSKRQDNVGVAPLEINDDVVSDSREKANLLSNYFKSVFTKEDLQNMPPEATSPYADIPPIHFSTAGITKLLQKVDCKKANGPDGIPCYILKLLFYSFCSRNRSIQARFLRPGSKRLLYPYTRKVAEVKWTIIDRSLLRRCLVKLWNTLSFTK